MLANQATLLAVPLPCLGNTPMAPTPLPSPPSAPEQNEGESINRTVMMEPRGSFVSFVNRLMGGDRFNALSAKMAKATVDSNENGPMPLRIDRFEVIRELGRGGFGIVYLARDAILGRNVAIKTPYRWLADDALASTRFLKEAQLASRLRHPGIVTLHDIRETDGRIEYIVQEFVEGSTLHEIMTQKRLSVRQSVDLVLKVAEAIQSAHALGVYHRDLKPANLIVDPQGEIHILDFGLAVDDETQIQLRGQIAGTVAYMSPEQLQGNSHQLDGRTDIWSLGVIFYELLTGRRPFRGNSQETAEQVIDRDPAPPRQFHASIIKSVEACCLKCLSKTLADRYASAADLVDDLKDILAGEILSEEESVVSDPESYSAAKVETKRLVLDPTKRIRTRPRSTRSWVVIGGGLSFLAICAISAALWRPALLDSNSGVASTDSRNSSDVDLRKTNAIAYLHGRGVNPPAIGEDKQLLIHSLGTFVRIFDRPIESLDYEIQMELRQIGPWQGNTGVLFAVNPSKSIAGQSIGYVIEVYPDENDANRWKMRYGQLLMTEHENKMTVSIWMRYEILLKGNPAEMPRGSEIFVAQIEKGKLKAVNFAGFTYLEPSMVSLTEFANVVALAQNHQTSMRMTGNVGIKVEGASVVVDKAVVIQKSAAR
jgi:serine/threonine protein kinase